MTPSTRRAVRELAASEADRRGGDAGASRRRTRRIVWIVVLVLVAAVLLCAVWLTVKVLAAKEALESAQQTVSTAMDGDQDAAALIASVAGDAATAAGASDDPLWRAAEVIPFAGDNLRAVRLAAHALDIAVGDIGEPILALQADGEGKIFARALPYLSEGFAALEPVAAELTAVAESNALVPPVRSGVERIAAALDAAAPVMSYLPVLMGADGPQNILLAFQNNAEALPLGGSPASQTLITADEGDLTITKQVGSGDFEWAALEDFDVPSGASALYGETYGSRVNMSVTRPDWPSSAEMLAAFWHRDIDDTQIDAVASIDPIALQRMLDATGPIEVGDVTIDSDNALKVLLSDVYTWWDAYTKTGAKESDAFFARVASTMIDEIASGDFEVFTMLKAVRTSIDKGDIMLWSADEEFQSELATARIGGVLPTDNETTTTLGIYYRDVSASKIDYYLKTEATATMTCTGETTTIVASTTLNLDISQAAADALPRYVQSYRHGSEYFIKQVFMYAPPGMQIDSVSVDGRDVSPFRQGNTDLGREVAPFLMTLRPGETAEVTATFSGTGDFGPLEVRTTPMIHATELTLDDDCH
ncbi:MAG: DUF4012 domain-containing protein [Microbacterium sp.]